MMLPEDVDKPWMDVIEVLGEIPWQHPPSPASFTQPVKRAVLQGGYIWGQILLKQTRFT